MRLSKDTHIDCSDLVCAWVNAALTISEESRINLNTEEQQNSGVINGIVCAWKEGDLLTMSIISLLLAKGQRIDLRKH